MQAHIEAIVKSLVAVAWADGRLDGSEGELLDALASAFELAEDDARRLKAFAAEPRTLDDVPLTELSADDRRLLLQHAVLITYVDGEQTSDERELLRDLAGRLRIPAEESEQVLSSADRRAQRLSKML